MPNIMDEKVNELKELYKGIFRDEEKRPSWAVKKHQDSTVPVHPTIPFVGEKYFESTHKKVLVYASAENLTFYDENFESDYLDDDEYALNRHRNKFKETKEDFFPNIHIGPMNNGALATAVLYICIKLGMDIPDDIKPAKFYEMIAAANYCKFSIEEKKNIDYANDKAKLKCSEEYVKADLEVLEPDYIILPKTIYDNSFKSFICGYAKENNITCIPIMQINQTTINCHINKNKEYKKYERVEQKAPIKDWYDELGEGDGKPKITGKTKDNYLAVFGYLHEVLRDKGLI